MSHRIEQVNNLLRKELAQIVNEVLAMGGALVTIAFVDCSPDLRSARIGISVLPFERSESARSALAKRSSELTALIRKRTRMRTVPRFNWVVDDTEEEAAKIDETLAEIERLRDSGKSEG